MGGLCPSKVRVHAEKKDSPIALIIDQSQFSTVQKAEDEHNQKIENEIHNELTGFSLSQHLLQLIEEISLSQYNKEFQEQRQFIQQQIVKPVSELIKNNCEFTLPELNTVLKQYYCFVTFVQSGNHQAVVAFWKELELQDLVSISCSIEYYNQQFFKLGGKLRREMAFRSLTPDVKTPERFIKTREWIKRQQQD